MPNIVTDPVNQGTYNYQNAGDFFDNIGHLLQDVIPYWLWGNSPDDPTSLWDRLTGGYDGDTGGFYPENSMVCEK